VSLNISQSPERPDYYQIEIRCDLCRQQNLTATIRWTGNIAAAARGHNTDLASHIRDYINTIGWWVPSDAMDLFCPECRQTVARSDIYRPPEAIPAESAPRDPPLRLGGSGLDNIEIFIDNKMDRSKLAKHLGLDLKPEPEPKPPKTRYDRLLDEDEDDLV
jgi:hypothetical protein